MSTAAPWPPAAASRREPCGLVRAIGKVCYKKSAMVEKMPSNIEDATQPVPDSQDPDYLAWKERQIRAAIRRADANPDDSEPLDAVAHRMRGKAERLKIK